MVERAVREFLACPACRARPLAFPPDGPLRCPSCGAGYPIDGGLPRLGPPGPFGAAGAERRRLALAFYREHAAAYDHGLAGSPFWNAVDEMLLGMVYAACPGPGVAVEIGCGTGRLTAKLARHFGTVLSFDLSEDMLREAARKPAVGGDVFRFVADAERVPLRDGVADCAVVAGVLCYLGAPADAIAESARILKPGGVLVGHENHRSAFRPAFDALMAVAGSWTEKSWPPRSMVGRGELEGWLRAAGLIPTVGTGVFVPPPLLNLLSPRAATRLLRSADAAAARVPWLRKQGGLLLFSARKAGTIPP